MGKSTLINYLTGRNKLAKTSSTPGKTQLINHFLLDDKWYLVDLPGYGYAKVSKDKRKQFRKTVQDYVLYRQNLMSLFLLIDSRHKPLQNDLDFMEWLGVSGVPFAIIFTKTDKLNSKDLESKLEHYKKRLLQTWEELPPMFSTSATKKQGRDEIMNYIHKINQSLVK